MAEEYSAVTINIKTAPHEELDGLQGGDDNGHYHLTEEEYALMSSVLTERSEEEESGGCFHKLEDEQYERLVELLDVFFPEEDAMAEDTLAELIDERVGTNNHEQLENLLGGEEAGHYHITAEQYHILQNLDEYIAAKVAAVLKEMPVDVSPVTGG